MSDNYGGHNAFVRFQLTGLLTDWMFALAITMLKLRNAASEFLPIENFEWHPPDWAGTNLRRRNTIRRAKKAR